MRVDYPKYRQTKLFNKLEIDIVKKTATNYGILKEIYISQSFQYRAIGRASVRHSKDCEIVSWSRLTKVVEMCYLLLLGAQHYGDRAMGLSSDTLNRCPLYQ